MAASLVGGALLSSVFNVLLERLTPALTNALNLIGGKKLNPKLLRRLKPSLFAAKLVLKDAELKQFTDADVKAWLDELRDAVYDLEDLMDEIFTKAATQKKVCDDLSLASLDLHGTCMADRLEEITETVECIVGQKDVLNLEKSSGMETLSWRSPVTSHVEISEVYGREKETEDIIKLMFNGDGDQMLSVIPIVGMGGVGKTTLAQLVYNDQEVKKNFDHTIWVCVSEVFDFLRIAQTIIKSISHGFVCDNMDLNLLKLHLAEKLERKKFLVVLDDVWNDKYTDWLVLKNLLHNGVEGCKVLVTTRLERVALTVKTISSIYHIKPLSHEDCLSIFAAHAFQTRDSTVNVYLEKNESVVASKCKGLPLAAKVLGGLLRSSGPNFKDWDNILKHPMWDSPDNGIIPALRVSYYYLPPHLKQCFAYCSLFPEDHQFDKEELVLMWMAEGFLQPSKGSMTLEEVGYEYFDDLTSRSFFQSFPRSDYVDLDPENEKTDTCFFVMHDLINKLANHVAGDFYLRYGENENKIGYKTRHLSCSFQNFVCLNHEVFRNSKGLRTFIGLSFYNIPKSIGNASHILLSSLKYLRTLSLKDLNALTTVPDCIGEFIFLRYLDLSNTRVESLPDSICKLHNLFTLKLCECIFLNVLPNNMHHLVNLRHLEVSNACIVSVPKSMCKLYNLQTLRLYGCYYLEILPSDLKNLVNLRHLDVRGTSLKEMPRGLGKLNDLQILDRFVVSKERETGIGELGGIPNLKGCIVISKLDNIKNGNEANEARLMEKQHVKGLQLSWSKLRDVEDTRFERDILANLEPHCNLERLKVVGYMGTIFPDWLASPSYGNMTWLKLEGCKNCCMLPPLGQLPSLKELDMFLLEAVVSIGDEFLKGNNCASMIPFPSLEYLRISFMASWETWHSIDTKAFPKLQQLQISYCNKLDGNLPLQLPSLETLGIICCPMFSSCIPRYPKLENLMTVGSRNVVWQQEETHSSLRELGISGCGMLEALTKCSHLQQLTISCSANRSATIYLTPSLQHLIITESRNINFVVNSNASLQSISFSGCDSLKFMSDGMEGLLPNLKKLCFVSHKVEEFPEGILVPSLREVHIGNSPRLLYDQAKRHLPNSITYLRIYSPFDPDVKCFPKVGSYQSYHS